MADIEIPAEIDKYDIGPLGKIVGSSNASPVVVAGKNYAVGELLFSGFEFAADPSRPKRYCGVFCFRPGQCYDHANRQHFDFLKPKATPAKKTKPAKGE